ncbi:MAG TPA: helix-turn-helix domain-containing protein [bacterium]|nr:helix-turn-helix domain-containing protein [bacterium]
MLTALAALPECASATLYTHEQDPDRYVLRMAAPSECAAVRHAYAPGEGPIGIAALRRKPARGRGRLYAVPILSARERVAGVIGLVARPSRALSRQAVLFTATVAQSISCALECEQLRDIARKHAELLDALERLTRGASNSNDAGALDSVARLGPWMIAGTTCAVYVRERHQAGLHLVAASPSLYPLPPICPDALVRASRREGGGAGQVRIGQHDSGTPPAGDVHSMGTVLVTPIPLDAERDGVLLILDHRSRRFSVDDVALVERLAQTAGIVLRNRHLCDLADERARPEVFLWETLDPIGVADPARTLAHARRLGHDLLRPHVVLVASARTHAQAEQLHGHILTEERNGLVNNLGTRVVAIVPAHRLSEMALDGLSVGVSRPCTDPERYPTAYRDAQEALDIGTKLFGTGRIISIEELESYRLIPAFMKGGLTETRDYQLMARVPDDLLKTLEVYLDAGGNATRAAKQLFLHRNTLRQRLDRIATLLGVDLAASERWLPLQLAVKAARLTRLAPTAGLYVGDGVPEPPLAPAAPAPHVELAEVSPRAHGSA